MMDCSSTNLKTKEALGNVLLQHPEPLRFTQGRWIQGVSLQIYTYMYLLILIKINVKFSFSGDTLSISYLMYKSTVALALLVIEIVILIYYPKGQIISE